MTPARLAWGLLGLTLVLTPFSTLTTWLLVADGSSEIMFAVGFALVQLSMASMGAFVASRLPQHRIGWLFLVIGVGLSIRQSFGSYAEIGSTTDRGPWPGDDVAAWLGDWPFIPIVAGGVILLLHWFPDGRFMSRRWSIVGAATAVIILLVTASEALRPRHLNSIETVVNPFGATGWLAQARDVVDSVTGGLAVLAFALAVTAMVVRIRRSSGVEREQIKWIMTDLALVAIFIAGSAALPGSGSWICLLLALGSLTALPVAAGIAIMRYRLYDIDLVINRTLVYGLLTASLAAIYLGSVLLLQVALSRFTAGSSLAIAVSTLAVAALFRPARTRIQNVVDRQFFRNKYDAQRTLERFGSHVRDQVDLSEIGVELLAVVNETVQPSHLGLWLRPSD